MGISADILVTYLDYSRYATKTLLDACAELPAAEVEMDRHSSHGGILGTLQHTFYADRVWLSRFRGTPVQFKGENENPTLAELTAVWLPLLAGFKEYVVSIGDAGVMESFTFRNLAGKEFTMPRYQALLHVVNHASVHRGQVSGMMRQAGFAPPNTDLINYFRQ